MTEEEKMNEKLEEAEEEQNIRKMKNYMESSQDTEMMSEENLDPEILLKRATSLAAQRNQEGNGSLDGTVSVFGTPTIRSIKNLKDKNSFLQMKLKPSQAPTPIRKSKPKIIAPRVVTQNKKVMPLRKLVPQKTRVVPRPKRKMKLGMVKPVALQVAPRVVRHQPRVIKAPQSNSQDLG